MQTQSDGLNKEDIMGKIIKKVTKFLLDSEKRTKAEDRRVGKLDAKGTAKYIAKTTAIGGAAGAGVGALLAGKGGRVLGAKIGGGLSAVGGAASGVGQVAYSKASRALRLRKLKKQRASKK